MGTTNSRGQGERSKGLNTLLEVLGRDGLYVNLDGPIDRVAAAYPVPKGAVDSMDDLLRIASDILRRVKEEIGEGSESVGGTNNVPEALHLIGRYYRSAGGIGLKAALQDAAAPGGSVASFLTVFLETIRAEHRGLWIQAAMARYVAPLNWAGRVAATEEVLTLMAAGFQGAGGPCPAERFSGNLESLLLSYIKGEDQIAGLLRFGGSEPISESETSEAARPL